MARSPKLPKSIHAIKHEEATRKNIPTAEMESFFLREEDSAPRAPVAYPRARPLAEGETRDRDGELDPQLIWNGASIRITPAQMEQLAATGNLELGDAQLVWRGKDTQDWSDLIVNVPPLYILEKIHPKAIIDDLKRRAAHSREAASPAPDLFADFNGIAPDARAEFYQHDQHWSNRIILGDSLQVMASLAERESLRGKVQCIYFDPPYGIKFNSNWQVSTQSRDVKDGKQADISREPEQVKAFRDTWKDGIHSYLTYLRDRLTVMRDLLTDSGSIFVQIGDENVHRVRAVMDEVFGEGNFVQQISFAKTQAQTSDFIPGTSDFVLWFARYKPATKYRMLTRAKIVGGEGGTGYRLVELDHGSRRSLFATERSDLSTLPLNSRVYGLGDLSSQRQGRESGEESAMGFPIRFRSKRFTPKGNRGWTTTATGIDRLIRANRIDLSSQGGIGYVRYLDDFSHMPLSNVWGDTLGQNQYGGDKTYVVQTGLTTVQRCILMATDPGDLVLDPTCGSGTTAFVAEQWGRRWITIDTSRVALALARTRIMAARYPWYLLADSKEGRIKEAALTRRVPSDTPVHNDIRHRS